MRLTGIRLLAFSFGLLPVLAFSHNYSTATRVHYVLDCLKANPGIEQDNGVEKCACVVDELAKHYTETEFDDIDLAFIHQGTNAPRPDSFATDKEMLTVMKTFQRQQMDAYHQCDVH